MTLDGYCDHTAIIPDDEIHDHYTNLLKNAGVVLYGRKTYQLMEGFWPAVVKNPTGNRAMDDFAIIMDRTPKLVFSRSLENVNWESADIAIRDLEKEVIELRQGSGDYILVGSRSLIIQLMAHNLIDEFQLCIHPVIAGGGLPLFEKKTDRTVFEFIKTKTFTGGAVSLYYKPAFEK